MTNLTAVVTQLEQERNRLSSQLSGVEQAIRALKSLAGRSSGPRTGGGISAAGHARIAAAARARWAKSIQTRPGFRYSRLQLLRGEQIAYPRLLDVTYKQAPKARGKAAQTMALPLE